MEGFAVSSGRLATPNVDSPYGGGSMFRLRRRTLYHILTEQRPYGDLGGDFFLRRERPDLLTRRLVRQLEGLGHRVTLEPHAA